MTEAPTLARLKRSRSAHRASVTKTISKAEEEIHSNPDGPRPYKLRQLKEALQEKLHTLDGINEIILKQVEDNELEDEIDGIDKKRSASAYKRSKNTLLQPRCQIPHLLSQPLSQLRTPEVTPGQQMTPEVTPDPQIAPQSREILLQVPDYQVQTQHHLKG